MTTDVLISDQGVEHDHRLCRRVEFLTPEYNHSLPAVLKNVIDSVFVTFGFRNKPSVCVDSSGGLTGAVALRASGADGARGRNGSVA